MLQQTQYIPFAEKTRATLLNTNASTLTSDSNSSFAGYNFLTSDGWLTPVVDPDSYTVEGQNSPESEAFVLDMQSAWRDWVRDGSKGSDARSIRLGPEVLWAWVGVGTALTLMVGTVAI